jgi:tRNA A-37 threonylcarbamoyl transferase component Bud32
LETKRAKPEYELNRLTLEFGQRIAGSAQITAVSLFDYCSGGKPSPKGAIQAIFVIQDFPSRLMSYARTIAGRTVVVFAVDQWIFERDIERGFLGEASVGTLVFPYTALSGERYLHTQEVALKKRLILELLENLRLSFPELSLRFKIKPEYFMYEVLLNRVRVFPPLAACTSNFMRDSEHGEKPNPPLTGYVEALAQLEKEGKVRMSQGYVMVPKGQLSETQKSRIWLTNLSRMGPRTLFTPIFEMFPQLLNLFNQNTEIMQKLQSLGRWKRNVNSTRAFVDPQKYVFVPTPQGLVSLAERIDVETFVRDKVLHGEKGDINVESVGGMLNDVYIIKISSRKEEKRILVKRFKDWSGFKWFPLNLWSLGTPRFAVLAKTRLEKECVISEILQDAGFNVPKMLHVSLAERLVFMEYINGETLANQIKKLANSKTPKPDPETLATFTRVGELIAKIHSLGVALGDTKPENVIINPAGEIYLLDFEQASRNGGDKTWDAAEFLYYSGHYLPPLHSIRKAEAIASAFIVGYLRGGGDVNVIKKASLTKYTRVFSLFTAPAVITAMSRLCQEAKAQS